MTELAKYTSESLGNLEAETGQATGFRQNGSIGVALSAERFEELKRAAAMGRAFGVEAHLLAPNEVKASYPLLDDKDIVGGVWTPNDGQTDPVGTTMAYAKGAKQLGERVFEDTEVVNILVENERAVGVRAKRGDDVIEIRAATVVLASGLWSHQIARKLGIRLALQAAEHFYVVTEAIKGLPILETTGIATWFNGPESFTPDDRFLLGETAQIHDLFVASGFNSIGIQSSGGAGKVLAQWIRDRAAPIDLPGMDVRRMEPFQGTRRYLAERTTESLGLLYQMHWPFRQYATGRGARRTAFHDRLLALGACMGELNGWERANWFDQSGSSPHYEYSFGRQNWFGNTAAECHAVQNAVALFDQSSMAKFLVQGRDACALLNRLSTAEIDVTKGCTVYTQWLNSNGGIEADLTIIRLAATEFMVVTSVSSHQRDLAYLRHAILADAHCSVTDITSGTPMLGLMGPNSRALMRELTGADLSNEAFPFGTWQELEIGYAIVRANRWV